MRLSQFPHVVFRMSCSLCTRRGTYRLARLAEKFGAETEVEDVVRAISMDCPWQRSKRDGPPRKYEARCNAFVEIEERPPDITAKARRESLEVIETRKGNK